MSRRWLVWWLLGAVVACSYYDSSLLEPTGEVVPGGEAGAPGGGAGSGGASGGAGGGKPAGGAAGGAGLAGASGAGVAGEAGSAGASAGAGGGVCQLAKPPGPPATAKSGGNLELLMALQKIDFGETVVNGQDAYKGMGFDLDGYCSCPDAPSCKGTDKDPTRYCDGDSGRDNAGGALISFVSKFSSKLSTQALNEQLAEGSFSLILRIRGYNGEADDDQVELSWLVADSYKTNHAMGVLPAFNGNDDWAVIDGSFEKTNNIPDPDRPAYADKNAYVTDFTVVGSLPGGTLRFPSFVLELTSPFLVGKLVPPSGMVNHWTSPEGTIAARWKTKNILGQLGKFEDPILKKPLCTDSMVFKSFKDQVCQYADITSTIAPLSAPCDALSIGFTVKAVQAKMASIVSAVPDPPSCPPETDPGTASCETP